MFRGIVKHDDPRILNPTFNFQIPWVVENDEEALLSDDDDTIPWVDENDEEALLSNDDDMFQCTQVSKLVAMYDNNKTDVDYDIFEDDNNKTDDISQCTQVSKLVDDASRVDDNNKTVFVTIPEDDDNDEILCGHFR